MKFGVREICDVVFKTTSANQKVGNTTFKKAGMPAFFIDTAKTSSMEQASTTVYANGGKGNNRLIAWEGEKTMTFTVEDALISPMGLSVLSGAGLLSAAEGEDEAHVHCAIDVNVVNGIGQVSIDDIADELYLVGSDIPEEFKICYVKTDNVNGDPLIYANWVDMSGAGIGFIENVVPGSVDDSNKFTAATATNNMVTCGDDGIAFQMQDEDGKALTTSGTARIDFYVVMTTGVTTINIRPEDFGGYYYVEAQTLFRREDDGKDMAAELIFPKVKVQSGFTFSMASSGDPSTFTFTMDAFPACTHFDHSKKVMCAIQVVGQDRPIPDFHTHPTHTTGA